MCRVGDIIVVKEFKDKNGIVVPRHSFVVISDEAGIIESYSYDFISNIMCSFHGEKHKKRKLNNEYSPQQATGYLSKAMLFLLLKFQI